MLMFLFPDDADIKITTDDIRLKSNVTTNRTIKLTKNLSSISY